MIKAMDESCSLIRRSKTRWGMPNVFIGAIFLLVLVLPPEGAAVDSRKYYRYRETVGEKITPFFWSHTIRGGRVEIVSETEEKSFVNICLPGGETLEWRLLDRAAGHDIKASRQGNLLRLSGTKNHKEFQQSIALGDKVWYQPLSFSLHQFLGAVGDRISFWSVRADNIEPVELEAIKVGEEKISHNSQSVLTQKVEVRLEGMFSYFWHGTYWFRKSDKQFLMYRSVHGLPGTPETVVQLLAEPQE